VTDFPPGIIWTPRFVSLINTSTVAVAPPPAVMIIPAASTAAPPGWWGKAQPDITRYGVLFENFLFARQWSNWPSQPSTTTRQTRIVKTVPLLPSSPPPALSVLQTTFLSTIQDAAQAAPGGEIILFVGHGGDGEPLPGTLPDPLHPNQTSFDLMPESNGFSQHTLLMTAEVLQRSQQPKRTDGIVVTSAHDTELDTKVSVMKAAGAAMKSARIGRFTILSCKVGATATTSTSGLPEGTAFVQGLATLLGVPLRAYNGYVMPRQITTTGPPVQAHIWVSPDHSGTGEPTITTTDTTLTEFHEVPAPTGLTIDRG
jgi:hypothetical protein